MFKKLILMALAVSSNYGMEPIKDIENKNVNSITQQMNNITLDSVQNNTNDINSTNNIQLSNIQASGSQVLDAQTTSVQPLFDIVNLAKTKQFKDMTHDEKDWMRLRAYDNFSKSCQTFIQIAFTIKDVTKALKDKFYNTITIRFCIMTGLKPRQIFEDELKFNIDKTCYEEKVELANVMTKISKVAQSLDKDMEYYRDRFLKLGCVNDFDI